MLAAATIVLALAGEAPGSTRRATPPVEVPLCALRDITPYVGRPVTVSGTIFHYPDALFVDDPTRAPGDGCALKLGTRRPGALDFGTPGGPPMTLKFTGRVSGVIRAYYELNRFTGKPDTNYRLDDWEAEPTP